MINTPVLFIFFNREDIAIRTFNAIAASKPTKVYLASDGARNESERVVVNSLRDKIISMITWNCEINTLFQEENLGCAKGVSCAINWLFDNEEKGVILEDDCLIQESFMPFMDEMLERYKDDQRIGMIDGANYITKYNIPDSYCFSIYKSTNGWGTWKRSWLNMDMSMSWRNTIYNESVICNMGYKSKDLKYWKYRLKVIDCKEASAWDWQWYFTLASQNQMSIFPQKNLVTNIGFGEGATHTTATHTPQQYIATSNLSFPLEHPKYVMPDIYFDYYFYKNNNTLFYTLMRYVPFALKKIIKKIVR